MSWLYLPEQEGDYSQPSGCLDGEPSATSKTQTTQSKSSKPEFETACSTMPQSGATPEPSTGDPGVDVWISSLRDSRASRSVEQGKDSPNRTKETFGPTPFALLEKSGPDGFYWKMCQGCFPTLTPDEFSETWPRAGMIVAGIAYRLPPLAPITRGTGCGLWPTPTVADSKNTRNSTANRLTTPPTGIHKGDTLVDAVTKWPTPTARDHRSGKRKSSHPTWNQLNDKVGGKLNPTWAEWLMDFPSGWTDLKPLEMPRFQQWLQQHGNY